MQEMKNGGTNRTVIAVKTVSFSVT